MESKIKVLYIITIIAIIAFLGMQGYWLYDRYEYALAQYEETLDGRVREAFTHYYRARWQESKNNDGDNVRQHSYRLEQKYGDTVTTRRTATITTAFVDAHELLGIPDSVELTYEQRARVLEMAGKMKDIRSESRVFDASSAPTENDAWSAAGNVLIEDDAPFTTEGIDSCLAIAGVRARTSLIVTDTILWKSRMTPGGSRFRPVVTFLYPYSELERKSVLIECPVGVGDVFPGMAGTLAAMAVLSALLILCLVWQFSTILRLNRIDRMRNSFVTTMIHELKRPVSTLKICVSGIENDRIMADPAIKTEILLSARNALENLSAYFSKLRDITFNSTAQIPLNPVTVNLRGLFDAVIASTTVPGGKSVEFENLVDEGIGLLADRTHLFNIVSNLVENAVKYSGARVRITFSAEAGEGYVLLRVSDNGNGISAHDRRYIFNRFYRGRAAASGLPGMGLGLAYVRQLVDAHGGDISVNSTEGRGTTFTIRLPQ